MEFFDKLTHYFNIVICIMLIGLVIAGVIFFYYKKIRKSNATKEDLVDYSNLTRRNSADYIKMDDIKDNMIIAEGNRRFIGVLRCRGFNFYSAQVDEQAATISNFLSFINTINKPISYRQYCKAVDLEDTTKMYEEAHSKVQEELYSLVGELKDIQVTLKNSTNMEKYQVHLFQETEKELVHKISALEFREFHLRDQMRYIENISGNSVAPEINETWVFDWTFDQTLFSVELSEDEIYNRAITELNAIAQAKIHSLSLCNVKAVRCKTEDLIEMFRRYSAPISADRYKLTDILGSSYFDDITSSSDPYIQIEHAEEVKREEEELRLAEENLKEKLSSNEKAKIELEDLRERSIKFEEELWKKVLDNQEKQSEYTLKEDPDKNTQGDNNEKRELPEKKPLVKAYNKPKQNQNNYFYKKTDHKKEGDFE